jgi:hypothetical protein
VGSVTTPPGWMIVLGTLKVSGDPGSLSDESKKSTRTD